MAVDRYGDCGLCGVIIEEGVCLEPFGNICSDCVKQIESTKENN